MLRKYLKLTILILVGVTSSSCQTEPHKNGADESGIFAAIDAGDIQRVQQILGANPEAVHQPFSDKNQGKPLHYASYVGNLPMVKLLVGKGADVNATGFSGRTPLAEAAQKGRYDVGRFLLSRGANVEGSKTATRPLHYAASGGHLPFVKLLLKHGADLNARAKNRNGFSALHDAAREGYVDVVKYLLLRGADKESKDTTPEKRTPVEHALHEGLSSPYALKTIEFLINHGAQVTPRASQELEARFPDYHWQEERRSFARRQKKLRDETLSELPEVLEELILKSRDNHAPAFPQ